jgi:hypothetical protein
MAEIAFPEYVRRARAKAALRHASTPWSGFCGCCSKPSVYYTPAGIAFCGGRCQQEIDRFVVGILLSDMPPPADYTNVQVGSLQAPPKDQLIRRSRALYP